MDAFDLLASFFGIIAAVLTAAVGAALDGRRVRRREAAWSRAAEELGFTLEQGRSTRSPVIRGHIDGRGVQVRMARRRLQVTGSRRTGTERSPEGRTRFTVSFTDPGFGLWIRSRHVERRRGRRVRFSRPLPVPSVTEETEQLILGHHLVRGADAEVLAAYMTPARRSALEEAGSSFREVSQGTVRASQTYAVSSSSEIVKRVRAMLTLAAALEATPEELAPIETQTAPPGIEGKTSVPGSGPGSPHAVGPEEQETPRGAQPEDRTLEPRPEIVAHIDGGTGTELDDEDDARVATEAATEPTPEPLPEASRATGSVPGRDPDPEPSPPPVEDLDVSAVARALFDSARPSFETAAQFARDHRGRRVRWRGRLLRADAFRNDLHLGPGPGTRAELQLLELAPGEVVPRTVRALVALPEEALPVLTALGTEEEVVVEATLASCDAFLRVLRLTAGRLA